MANKKIDNAAHMLMKQIGLDAARDGDPKGLALFLDWVESELFAMSVNGQMPKPITDRIADDTSNIRGTRIFVNGFNAAMAMKS